MNQFVMVDEKSWVEVACIRNIEESEREDEWQTSVMTAVGNQAIVVLSRWPVDQVIESLRDANEVSAKMFKDALQFRDRVLNP